MRRRITQHESGLSVAESVDSLQAVAEGLASRIPTLKRRMPDVIKALHEILDGMDTPSIEVRTGLQLHLVRVASGLPLATEKADARMLSTEEAAAMMQCSRPYVAMLVDQKQLPGSIKTPGGHRKIPVAAVRAWINDHLPEEKVESDYKAAAREAGMYDIPERTYVSRPKRPRQTSRA